MGTQLDYNFKTEPFSHQREEWLISRELPGRAIFWEQGTGKSKLTVDTACWMYQCGMIDAVVVVAPNGVHRNWVENEILDHTPDAIMAKTRAFAFQSAKAETKWHKNAVRSVLQHSGLSWFAISYEGFMTNAGKRALTDFFDKRRTLYVLDESHNIKSPEAERTKSILRSAPYSAFRRLLTGTPIAQGPFDAYSQVQFLDRDFWARNGFATFADFKVHFATWKKIWNPHIRRTVKDPVTGLKRTVMGGEIDAVASYRRLDELQAILKTISSRVTKDEVLDLPPKLYTKHYVTLSPEQSRYYREMRDEYMVWLESSAPQEEAREVIAERASQASEHVCPVCSGTREVVSDGFIYPCFDCEPGDGAERLSEDVVVAELAMVRMLRLQQIICGYLPTDREGEPLHIIPGVNRRLMALCDNIEAREGKTIVWARFQLDITLILEELERRGISAVRYDGLVDDEARALAKARFQGERPVRERGIVVGREPVPVEEQAQVFVANPAAGATGLTLTVARFVDYYSNNFKLIDRLQSEDRAHRIGQTNKVLYTDYVAEDTVDDKIVEALRNKFNIATRITGDRLKEWL